MTRRFFNASGPNVVGEYSSDIDCPPISETPACEAPHMGGRADARKRSNRPAYWFSSRAERLLPICKKIVAISTLQRECFCLFPSARRRTRRLPSLEFLFVVTSQVLDFA